MTKSSAKAGTGTKMAHPPFVPNSFVLIHTVTMEAVDQIDPFSIAEETWLEPASMRASVVPFRFPTDQSPTHFSQPRSIAERVEHLTRFVAHLELRLNALYSSSTILTSRRALAQESMLILRQLLMHEVGTTTLEDSGDTFFRKLWSGGGGGSAVQALFSTLFQEARAILVGGIKSGVSFSNPSKVLAELEIILSWYLRRKMSLLVLDQEQFGGEQRDRIFSVHILPDATWCSVHGIEVRCGVCLIGRAYEQVWFKLLLKERGQYVEVSERGRFWTDDSHSWAAAPANDMRVAAVVPLAPQSQRCVVDELRVFLPYDALQLEPGPIELEYDLGVYGEQGEQIASWGQLEVTHIPRRNRVSGSRKSLLPSPQALGIWPKDFVSGDRVSELRISSGYRDLNGECHKVVQVTLDFDLCEHLGEKIILECRVLYPDGSLLESNADHFRGPEGSFRYREELYPQRDLVRTFGHMFKIPLRALSLDVGAHELLFEMTLLSSAERVLCGTLGLFRAEVEQESDSRTDVPHARIVTPPAPDPYTGLSLTSFEAEFIRAVEKPVADLRLSFACFSPDWSTQAFRVLFTIEEGGVRVVKGARSGRELMRSICVGGYQSEGDQSLVVYVSGDELYGAEREGGETARTEARVICARARVFTVDDRTIFDLSREIQLPARVESEAQSQDPGEPLIEPTSLGSNLWMEEVLTQSHLHSKTLNCDFCFNVNFLTPEAAQATLYLEVVDAFGRPYVRNGEVDHGIANESSIESDSLCGVMHRVNFTPIVNRAVYRGGFFQLRSRCEMDISAIIRKGRNAVRDAGVGSAFLTQFPENSMYLKIMFFSHDGRLTRIEKRPLNLTSGVFVEEELPGARIQPPDQQHLEPAPAEERKKRSLFARMFR